jgi:hypothetical protein
MTTCTYRHDHRAFILAWFPNGNNCDSSVTNNRPVHRVAGYGLDILDSTLFRTTATPSLELAHPPLLTIHREGRNLECEADHSHRLTGDHFSLGGGIGRGGGQHQCEADHSLHLAPKPSQGPPPLCLKLQKRKGYKLGGLDHSTVHLEAH